MRLSIYLGPSGGRGGGIGVGGSSSLKDKEERKKGEEKVVI